MRSPLKPIVIGITSLCLCGAAAEPAQAGKGFFKKAKKWGREFNHVAINVGNAAVKAVDDTGKTLEKAGQDTVEASKKAEQDLVVVVQTSGRYIERQAHGVGDTVSDAAKRVREGKFIDAAWHLAVDPLRHTERNTAKAAQESNILRTVGQVAASAYGGPSGAAAFSTWYAYRATGDVKTALRAGAVTGATSLVMAQVATMPSKTAAEIAGKAATAGVVGGAAVVVSGGKPKDVRDGFLMGAATSLAQSVYENTTESPLNARSSQGEGFCKASPGANCAPPAEAYMHDSQGQIVKDGDTPLVDMKKLSREQLRRPHVGTFADAEPKGYFGITERHGFMTDVSRVPGMNAMAVFHDNWSVSWRMPVGINQATIVPATILTYTATGAPMTDRLRTVRIRDREREVTN